MGSAPCACGHILWLDYLPELLRQLGHHVVKLVTGDSLTHRGKYGPYTGAGEHAIDAGARSYPLNELTEPEGLGGFPGRQRLSSRTAHLVLFPHLLDLCIRDEVSAEIRAGVRTR